jgi:hypothetical protein
MKLPLSYQCFSETVNIKSNIYYKNKINVRVFVFYFTKSLSKHMMK